VDRLAIEMLDGAGRTVTMELSIRQDTVECWTAERRCAVFDREQLRAWFAAPLQFCGDEDITWGCTGDGVAVTVDHVVPWRELTMHDLNRVRERI
jgi:hypothetical protein